MLKFLVGALVALSTVACVTDDVTAPEGEPIVSEEERVLTPPSITLSIAAKYIKPVRLGEGGNPCLPRLADAGWDFCGHGSQLGADLVLPAGCRLTSVTARAFSNPFQGRIEVTSWLLSEETVERLGGAGVDSAVGGDLAVEHEADHEMHAGDVVRVYVKGSEKQGLYGIDYTATCPPQS